MIDYGQAYALHGNAMIDREIVHDTSCCDAQTEFTVMRRA
jgi:hypothetical protein